MTNTNIAPNKANKSGEMPYTCIRISQTHLDFEIRSCSHTEQKSVLLPFINTPLTQLTLIRIHIYVKKTDNSGVLPKIFHILNPPALKNSPFSRFCLH